MNEDSTHSTAVAPRRGAGVVLVIALVVGLVAAVLSALFYPETLEDAFITFRYSKHLAEGHGLGAWNTTGERVEGYTTFLWMMVLAAAPWLGVEIATLAKILGILAYIGLAILFVLFPLLKKRDLAPADTPLGRNGDLFLVAGALVGLSLPMAWYASSGMETTTFVLLVGLAFLGPFMWKRAVWGVLVAAALVLTRPEGIVFAVATNGFHLFRRRYAQEPYRDVLLALAASVIGFVALTVLRMFVFGQFLPNSYYAKAGGAGLAHLADGKNYLEDWAGVHWPWIVLLVAAITCGAASIARKGLSKNVTFAFLAAFVGLYTLYIVRVGGDNPWAFPFWRHMLHLLPFLAILVAAGLVNSIPRRGWLRLLVVAALVLTVNYASLAHVGGKLLTSIREGGEKFPNLANALHDPYYLWLAGVADQNTVIASAFGGELPFVVDAIHIDMLGLNDEYIAHHGRFDAAGPPDSKTDMAYVLDRKPDIVEGYIKGSQINEGLAREQIVRIRRNMVDAMLDHPIFKSQYLFLANGPYYSKDRALFFHREFWEGHPDKDEFKCVPVLETSLYVR